MVKESNYEKKTVGSYSYELQQKNEKINPIDLQRQVHKGNNNEDSYENQIRLAVERGCKLYDNDFFVIVIFKKERLMVNVVRQYFLPRQTCPRPEYDQVVYRYFRGSHSLEFVWVIPDKETCSLLPFYKDMIPKEQSELSKFVFDFNSGKLDELSDSINRELLEKTPS
jgi:hypothetical protein